MRTMTSLLSALTRVTRHHHCKEVQYTRCNSHLTDLLHETFVRCREDDPNVAWQRCTHCMELHRLIRTAICTEKARWCKECYCYHAVRHYMHASRPVTAADSALLWCALSYKGPFAASVWELDSLVAGTDISCLILFTCSCQAASDTAVLINVFHGQTCCGVMTPRLEELHVYFAVKAKARC